MLALTVSVAYWHGNSFLGINIDRSKERGQLFVLIDSAFIDHRVRLTLVNLFFAHYVYC